MKIANENLIETKQGWIVQTLIVDIGTGEVVDVKERSINQAEADKIINEYLEK